MASMSRSEADRRANQQTARTGRVHTVQTRRGILGTKRTVKDTGRTANPTERRKARTSW
jgi:hypothetical protein